MREGRTGSSQCESESEVQVASSSTDADDDVSQLRTAGGAISRAAPEKKRPRDIKLRCYGQHSYPTTTQMCNAVVPMLPLGNPPGIAPTITSVLR
jgi:hypothetical protein